MKKYFTKLQTIFFIVLVSFAYMFFIEIITRTSLFFITKHKQIFFYGINKNFSFEISDLSQLDFNVIDINKEKLKNVESELNKNMDSSLSKIVIWTFGASLTYGYSCGENSSSWPEELKKLNNNIEIINFGFPSFYSDDSIKILNKNLNKKNVIKPNYIFWSHRDEEKLSIYLGLQRNKYKIKNKMSYEKNLKNLLSLKIAKTLESNFTSYVILKHIIDKLKKRFNIYQKGFDKDAAIKDNDKLVAIENYALNTQEAIDITKINNIKNFVIVSLLNREQITSQKNKFLEFYYNSVDRLIFKNNIRFVDTYKFLSENDKNNINQFFCKNGHFALYGNQYIAKTIYKNIIN